MGQFTLIWKVTVYTIETSERTFDSKCMGSISLKIIDKYVNIIKL